MRIIQAVRLSDKKLVNLNSNIITSVEPIIENGFEHSIIRTKDKELYWNATPVQYLYIKED